MAALAIFYLTISTGLAFIVAICVAAAPKGQRVELAKLGGIIASLWFIFLVALLVDVIITRVTRLARRVTRR
jgi:hypothetical protein